MQNMARASLMIIPNPQIISPEVEDEEDEEDERIDTPSESTVRNALLEKKIYIYIYFFEIFCFICIICCYVYILNIMLFVGFFLT